VSALLSKLLSKNGNEGASDQVFMVRSFGHFVLIASVFDHEPGYHVDHEKGTTF
jgi:hypothetical protein